jgi:hypothetical protein
MSGIGLLLNSEAQPFSCPSIILVEKKIRRSLNSVGQLRNSVRQ